MPDPLPIEPVDRPLDATVTLPGSKSITNRALVCAALADGPSALVGALDADDTEAMIDCLGRLGIGVRSDGGTVEVEPAAPWASASIDARQSGTTSRFLLPVLALDGVARVLDGDEQLRARPMGPSFDALRALGADVVEQGEPGHLPVEVRGPLRAGTVDLSGDVSSQFLSGLLLAGPAVPGGVAVRLTTELISRPYVEMTAAVMAAFGAAVTEDAGTWTVAPGGYRGTRYVVEPDASAASYAWAAALVSGGRVTVPGLHRGSLQGDVAFADVLESMGASVTWHDDAVTVAAGARLRGIDVDMAHISDTVPTLAVLAALADGPTTIRGVGFIRGKESDRIAAPVAELQRCGIDATATDDGMVIRPGPLRPATFETYRDHRMAMAFALLGLAAPGMAVRDPGCVAKTFPGFWGLLDALRAGSVPPARAR
ncbi:MAG TPA: 3-phosphoshikimate 1-carboxyvinyltransferase [Acidimicrobiales bacterium]|nr:3-phosphoshikimate 1-carboxyvinyltransferase [Acidimicrobiales bacterium]